MGELGTNLVVAEGEVVTLKEEVVWVDVVGPENRLAAIPRTNSVRTKSKKPLAADNENPIYNLGIH